MSLAALGWDEWFESRAREAGGKGLVPARVVETHKRVYMLAAERGDFLAKPAGKLLRSAEGHHQMPTAGDWVLARPPHGHGQASIEVVLPRRTKLSRKAADEDREQIIGANLDSVFLVTSCNQEFNARRVERYVTAIQQGGAEPVLVLNKCDLVPPERLAILESEAALAAPGVPMAAVSAKQGSGIEALRPFLAEGRTVCLVGSSGVGKSTLLNRLMGSEVALTKEIREDDSRGRHTTTNRALRRLPSGALVIDTPGMREFAPWGAEEAVVEAFPEIDAIAPLCRFRDCVHDAEPGCAVREALEQGRLDAGRFDSYLKLKREQAFQKRKEDPAAAAAERRKWRSIHKSLKAKKKG